MILSSGCVPALISVVPTTVMNSPRSATEPDRQTDRLTDRQTDRPFMGTSPNPPSTTLETRGLPPPAAEWRAGDATQSRCHSSCPLCWGSRLLEAPCRNAGTVVAAVAVALSARSTAVAVAAAVASAGAFRLHSKTLDEFGTY